MDREIVEMIREIVEIEYPAELKRGRSRQADGASSPNLFDPGSKGVKGQVRIFDIDKGERATVRAELVDTLAQKLVSLAVDVAVAKATPHVERWWDDNALPAITSTIKSTRNKIAKARKADRQAGVAELATFVKAAPTDFSKEVDAAAEEDKASMSSAEARKRLLVMLVAAAMIEELKRELSDARIEDDDGFLAWKSSMEKFTPQEVEDRIGLMLEANPSWLDKFVDIFGGGRIVDGQYVLVTSENIKEVLRLTDGEN